MIKIYGDILLQLSRVQYDAQYFLAHNSMSLSSESFSYKFNSMHRMTAFVHSFFPLLQFLLDCPVHDYSGCSYMTLYADYS